MTVVEFVVRKRVAEEKEPVPVFPPLGVSHATLPLSLSFSHHLSIVTVFLSQTPSFSLTLSFSFNSPAEKSSVLFYCVLYLLILVAGLKKRTREAILLSQYTHMMQPDRRIEEKSHHES